MKSRRVYFLNLIKRRKKLRKLYKKNKITAKEYLERQQCLKNSISKIKKEVCHGKMVRS